jgi:hypothetical protein
MAFSAGCFIGAIAGAGVTFAAFVFVAFTRHDKGGD